MSLAKPVADVQTTLNPFHLHLQIYTHNHAILCSSPSTSILQTSWHPDSTLCVKMMMAMTLPKNKIFPVRLHCAQHPLPLLLLTSFTDLREQHDVRLEQGLDSFVIVDGLPIVEEANKPKLQKFLLGKLNSGTNFKIKDDGFYMPISESGKSEGYVVFRYCDILLKPSALRSSSTRIRNRPSRLARKFTVQLSTKDIPLASIRLQT